MRRGLVFQGAFPSGGSGRDAKCIWVRVGVVGSCMCVVCGPGGWAETEMLTDYALFQTPTPSDSLLAPLVFCLVNSPVLLVSLCSL